MSDDSIIDDEDVRARRAAGELVPLVAFGEPPTRPEWMATLRDRARGVQPPPPKRKP